MLSLVRLFTTPWAVALQAPLSMGFFSARILEWVAMPSRGCSWPRNQTHISCISCINLSVLQTDSLPLSYQGSPTFFLSWTHSVNRWPLSETIPEWPSSLGTALLKSQSVNSYICSEDRQLLLQSGSAGRMVSEWGISVVPVSVQGEGYLPKCGSF